MLPRSLAFLLLLALLAACARATPTPSPLPTITPAPLPADINLDADTQTLIANANRVAFIIPFSHWDTDWHEDFAAYVKRTDGNILNAIQMAQADSRFRYTIEQVLFAQHFWDTFPEHREALKAAVQSQQITFAWGGIIQPETSLAAPAVQARNLQLGQQWIADTFGPQYMPRTAWQSDAFGNSAAFSLFLTQNNVPYLFIGRSQFRCRDEDVGCQPLPHIFHWRSPATNARVLVTYLSYPAAWDAIHRLTTEAEQLTALRAYIDEQFARTDSKYVFIPMGSDMIDPLPNLMSLVDKWNAADQKTVLAVADPQTAFDYIATQTLPEFAVDLNPIWQAFYATHPDAKIMDKQSEYYLTAADKFGMLIDAPMSSAWLTATINAHYDNIGAVSYDWVWAGTQRPRFEQTVSVSAGDLASTLAHIANGVPAPFVVFNPSSWPRSEVIELSGALPDTTGLTTQVIGPDHIALYAANIPAIGYSTVTETPVRNPASITQSGNTVTLSNGLVSVTLDPAHGGTFSILQSSNSPNLLTGPGDDLTFWNDSGDVYGAFFGEVRARESDVPATLTVLAAGPLLARVQATFTLGDAPLTKTITLRADSPLVEVTLDVRALPETSAVAHSPTMFTVTQRTDDLGFAAFTHPIDARPIISGDITYRRKIFYPITYWSTLAKDGAGLTLVTQGLQGIAGSNAFNFLLARSVTRDEHDEGVEDLDYHTVRYAYWPHIGEALEPWKLAYAFNQPLIPVWRGAGLTTVRLPFQGQVSLPTTSAQSFPESHSLLSAESGFIADVYEQDGQTFAVVIDYDPATPVTITRGDRQFTVTVNGLATIALEP